MKNKSIAGLLILAVLAPNCGGGAAPSKLIIPPAAKWQTLQRIPTTSNLRAVLFNNSRTGLIAGEDGTIFYTSDGGDSWLQEDFTPASKTGHITSMSALNATVVAVGTDPNGSGRYWRTDDTLTWTTPNATATGAPYVDATLASTGIGPQFPVTIIALRQDAAGTMDAIDPAGVVTSGPSGTWTNARGIVYIPTQGFTYVCGDSGGVGQINRSGALASGSLPPLTKTVRRVAVTPGGKPWACGDNTSDQGIVMEIASIFSPDTWTAIPGAHPPLPSLQAISFPTLTMGWAVGNNGTIYRLSKNGATWTWTDQNPGLAVTGEHLYGVSFSDNDHGWIVGNNGTVLRTTNGSSAGPVWWTKISGGGAGINWNALSFSDDGLRGLAVGNGAGNAATIYRTVNGGATWAPMANPAGLTNQNLNGASVPRTNGQGTTAYICGASGMLFRNTDVWGAGVWDNTGITGTSGTDNYRAILFPAPGKGVVVGNNAGTPVLLRTADGLTWAVPTPANFTATLPSASYNGLSSNVAGTAVYASGGTNGAISVSTDLIGGWDSWANISTPTGLSTTLSAIQSPEGTFFKAIVAAADGNVYRLDTTVVPAWTAQTGTPWGSAKPIGLGFQGELNAMVVTDAGFVYHSVDGGDNWALTYPHTKAKPRAIWTSLTVSGLGYVGCDDGVILKTLSSGE